MKYTLSVALTTYNGCPYIGPQLDSIAAQTRRPDEIVIGDDGSDDGTAQVVARFAEQRGIPAEWHRNPTRLGYVRNFEQVVARCSGDIIVFSDQDDVWMPQKLARLEAALHADPGAAFAFSNTLFMDEHGKRLRGTMFGKLGFGAAERARFREGGALGVLLRRNVVAGATLAVRRAALMRLLPFEPSWGHDAYLPLALSVLSRAVVLDEPLICYRRHASQQVGLPSADLKGLLGLLRWQSAAESQEESENFERLRARLLALGVDPALPELAALRGKARLLAQRAEMRARRKRAPRLMWLALRDGGYQRYGVGWKQLVLDLVALGVRPMSSRPP